MDLVEINYINLQALEAGFDFAADRLCFQAATYLTPLVPHQLALGKNIGTLGAALQRLGNHLLGVSETVDGRGIDPVHAGVERSVNGGNRVIVILLAPAELPAAAAHRPGPDTERRNLHIAVAQLLQLHRRQSSSR